MNSRCIQQKFEAIKVWRRGDERAPHKPLLLLLILGRYAANSQRQIAFAEIDAPLRSLLEEFGPPRRSHHSEYPFWRLQNDGIWELENAEHALPRKSNTDAKKSELIKHNVTGGLTEEIYDAVTSDRALLREIALGLIDRSFPASLHSDILEAVGLNELLEFAVRRNRDPKFRQLIMTAYEYRCAICGLDLRISGREIGLEAAHIMWWQAGGPDSADNGLALCSLHHKLFDRGAIGLGENLEVLVSEHLCGTEGFERLVLAYHGKKIRLPQRDEYLPEKKFIAWHQNEVFRTPSRTLLQD